MPALDLKRCSCARVVCPVSSNSDGHVEDEIKMDVGQKDDKGRWKEAGLVSDCHSLGPVIVMRQTCTLSLAAADRGGGCMCLLRPAASTACHLSCLPLFTRSVTVRCTKPTSLAYASVLPCPPSRSQQAAEAAPDQRHPAKTIQSACVLADRRSSTRATSIHTLPTRSLDSKQKIFDCICHLAPSERHRTRPTRGRAQDSCPGCSEGLPHRRPASVAARALSVSALADESPLEATSPFTPDGPSETPLHPTHPPSAQDSTAPTPTTIPLHHTNNPELPSQQQPSSEPPKRTSSRKRRRRECSTSPQTGKIASPTAPRTRKRPRTTKADDSSGAVEEEPSMRLEHNHDRKSRHSTNGSSINGSSPHTNGSAGTNGVSDTNGYHANGHAAVVHNTSPFYGHDREEVTRILLQSLNDLGYSGAARQLSEESGYELEIPSVAAFRRAVLHGEWVEAEEILLGQEVVDGGVALTSHHSSPSWIKKRTSAGSQNGFSRHGLPLSEEADTTWLKFLLRRQKYLELLEDRDLNGALSVLRNELTPLKRDTARLHALSSLMMSQSAEDLRSQANWDGAEGESRSDLLSEISTSISPSVMIPEHRLATLLSDHQQHQILNCRYHNTPIQPSLYTDHECSPDDFPLQTLVELRHHTDEVWYVEFSHDGSMLATAGKDGLVCVYDTVRWKIRHEFHEHERERPTSNSGQRGVVYVTFSPDDQYLISCSQNNEFVVVNVQDGRRVATGDHFDYPVSSAAWLPDSTHFVVGSQASRHPLGLYSLRSSSSSNSSNTVPRNNEIYSWRDPPWEPVAGPNNTEVFPGSFRVSDCAVSSDGTRMAAITVKNKILFYDLRSRYKIAEWQMEDNLTSITFSSDGEELLVNMNEGKVFTMDPATGEVRMRYEGMQQRNYVVRSCFGGAGEGFVVSGSEDSRIYIWRRQTGLPIAVLDAHTSGAVNAVAWHPTNPAVFASAGDDRRVRIWSSASALRPHALESGPGSSTIASRTSVGGSYPFAYNNQR